jgi:hypothetical protein
MTTPSDADLALHATAWRHRGTGEVAVASFDIDGTYAMFGVDDAGDGNGKRYTVRDEAELQRDWERVRRGWVAAEGPHEGEVRAMLAKVTEELRGACEQLHGEFDISAEEGQERLVETGVIEAEQLLARLGQKGGG